MLNKKIRVLHLLASNKYSGAENVACQIISCFSDFDEAYCSPMGSIKNQLEERGIKFFPIKKLTRKQVQKILLKFNPDIIHAHDAKASVIASFCCKNIPVVSHIHCNDKKFSKISIKSILFKLASKRMSHIFFVSEGSLNSFKFKKLIQNKSSVLHNVIDINSVADKIKQNPDEYSFDIVYVGRLTEIKNPLRLVDVMAQVVKIDKNVKLGIVGDGEMKQDLQNYISEKQMDDNIELLGFMSNPYKVISCSKLMLMTSISEGLPMCVLEALSVGVPIISTKTDGLKEIIQNDKTGYLFDTNSEASSKILELLKNKEELELMKYNAINFSKNYNDLEKYKKTILEVYLKSLGR